MERYTTQKIFVSLAIFIFLGIATVLVPVVGWADSLNEEGQARFSSHSIHGAYGFVIDGAVIDYNVGTNIPGTAVGRFIADGKGSISEGVRTLNIGGEVQEQIFTGTYAVSPEGTGSVKVRVSTLGPDGAPVPSSIETAKIVIVRPGDRFELIGTSIRGPAGEDLNQGLVTRGVAKRQ